MRHIYRCTQRRVQITFLNLNPIASRQGRAGPPGYREIPGGLTYCNLLLACRMHAIIILNNISVAFTKKKYTY